MIAPSITSRILLAAALPATLVTMLLSAWLVVAQVSGIRDVEIDHATTLLNGLAQAGEFGVATGNVALLDSIARGALGSDTVQEIRFDDASGERLAGVVRASPAGGLDGVQPSRWWWHEAEPRRQLARAVTRTDLSVFDDPMFAAQGRVDTATDGGRRIGTVSLEIDLSAAFAQQTQAVLRGVAVASIVLLLALLGSWRLARSVSGTLEAHNRELSDARSVAERASRAKSQFLASMSHEIRTPMHTIVGTLSALRRTSLGRDQRTQIELVEQSSRTLLSMLDDVLDLSRIEAGRLKLDHIDFDLLEVLREVEWTHAESAGSRALLLDVAALPDDVPTRVTGDSLRLKQVLFNLLANAIKFTEAGSVRLEIDRHVPAPATGEPPIWRFSVIDTGMGIPADRLASMFEPFEQADMSTTRRFGGTGLGLHICREIVVRMGGTIELRSTVGIGTRVDVRLPLPQANSVSVPMQNDTGRATALVGHDGHANGDSTGDPADAPVRVPHVLAVDDQAINLQLLGRFFDLLGARVTLVQSADEALATLQRSRFDLLLLDLHMPGVDGFEIAAAVRGRGFADVRMPILALTADAFDSTRQRALESGFDEVLVKPVTVEQLDEALQRWTGALAGAVQRPISLERTAHAAGGDIDWARTALKTFASEVPDHVAALEQALHAQDKDALFQTAHAIKGVSAVLRIDRTCTLAEQLSRGTQVGEWQEIQDHANRLLDAMLEAQVACREVLASA